MKPRTSKFLQQLEIATDGLLFYSESEFPLQPIAFELKADESWTIEKLLQTTHLIRPCQVDSLLQHIHDYEQESQRDTEGSSVVLKKEYKKFTQLLQLHLKEISLYEVYRQPLEQAFLLGNEDLQETICYLLFGQTENGEWIGWSPRLDIDEWIMPSADSIELPSKAIEFVRKPTLDLVKSLQSASSNLLFPKEGAARLEWVDDFLWRSTATRQAIVDRLLLSNRFVRMFEFENFSTEFYQHAGNATESIGVPQSDYEYGHRLYHLDQVLRSHLHHLRTYMVGANSHFLLYAVGQIQNGDWAGVMTQGVWT